MSGTVFVSYRRHDTGHAAARIGEQLVRSFGRDRVFMDVYTIRPGANFGSEITRAVGSCQVLLALIGNDWTTAANEDGRRLDGAEDWVALEIATALERQITVIPVLIDGATMPPAGELPARIQALVRRNAHRVDQATFKYSVAALVDEVRSVMAEAPEGSPSGSPTARRAPGGRRRRRGVVVGGLLSIVAAGLFLALSRYRTDEAADAGGAGGAVSRSVTLAPVEDRGNILQLTWTGPTDLDYAVAVAPEGGTVTPSLVGRVSSARVAVDPAGRYCARVSATDDGQVVASNVQPVRGASCSP